jgi:hypothetical protein
MDWLLKSRKKTIIVSKFLHLLQAIFYGLLATRLILRIFPLIDGLHLSRKIIKISLEHMVAWKNISNPIEEKWITPLPQRFKINFNMAIRDIFSAQAAMYRNHLGHIIKIIKHPD